MATLGGLGALVATLCVTMAELPSRLDPLLPPPRERVRIGVARPVDLPQVAQSWFDVSVWPGRVALGASHLVAGLVHDSRAHLWAQHDSSRLRWRGRLTASSLRVGEVASVQDLRAIVHAEFVTSVPGLTVALGGLLDQPWRNDDRVPATRRLLVLRGDWEGGSAQVVRVSPRTSMNPQWAWGIAMGGSPMSLVLARRPHALFLGVVASIGGSRRARVVVPLAGLIGPGPALELGWSP